MIRIDFLKNHPEHIQAVADWVFGAWGDGTPAGHERAVSRVQERLHDDRVPLTLVALDDAMPVGTVSLFERDLDEWDDLTPWLAALYVDAQYRGKGVGAQLVEQLRRVAAALGFGRLYLQAQDAREFYVSRGWLEVGSTRTGRGETWVLARDTVDLPTILYRADGGERIGLGHVMHAVRLDEALRHAGVASVLLAARPDEAVSSITRQRGMPAPIVVEDADDPGLIVNLARSCKAAAVAVNYPKQLLEDARPLFEALREAGLVQIHFDNPMPDVELADLAVNALPHPDWGVDVSRLPRVHDGLEYLVLDPSASPKPQASRVRRIPPSRILISMGGSDPDNLSTLVLRALGAAGFNGSVDIVVGVANPHTALLGDVASSAGMNTVLHEHVPSLNPLIAEADIAFSALGLTTYEFAAAGLPTVIIAGNEFNATVANLYAGHGAAVSLGYYQDWTSNALGDEVARILRDSEALAAMSLRGPEVVDGRGTERVTALVSDLLG